MRSGVAEDAENNLRCGFDPERRRTVRMGDITQIRRVMEFTLCVGGDPDWRRMLRTTFLIGLIAASILISERRRTVRKCDTSSHLSNLWTNGE
jgi:hypothetical protein